MILTLATLIALLITLFSRKHSVVKVLVGEAILVVACMATLTLRHWSTGHWALGHIDGKMPAISGVFSLHAWGAGVPVSVLAVLLRWITSRRTAQRKREMS